MTLSAFENKIRATSVTRAVFLEACAMFAMSGRVPATFVESAEGPVRSSPPLHAGFQRTCLHGFDGGADDERWFFLQRHGSPNCRRSAVALPYSASCDRHMKRGCAYCVRVPTCWRRYLTTPHYRSARFPLMTLRYMGRNWSKCSAYCVRRAACARCFLFPFLLLAARDSKDLAVYTNEWV